MDPALKGLLAATLAGSATSIGALPVFFIDHITPRPVAASLAFSAGVMLYVSMTELTSESRLELSLGLSDTENVEEGIVWVVNAAAFVAGYLVAEILDTLVHIMLKSSGSIRPVTDTDNGQITTQSKSTSYEIATVEAEGSHESIQSCKLSDTSSSPKNIMGKKKRTATILLTIMNCGHGTTLDATEEEWDAYESAIDTYLRTGLTTAIALGFHNFPEGMATFLSFLGSTELGYGMVMAITLHNIPEGFSVALPIYLATKNKWLAFMTASLSGFVETIAAVITYFIIDPEHVSPTFLGVVYGALAGVMTHVALNELLVVAAKFDRSGNVIFPSIFSGFVVMGLSLMIFALVAQQDHVKGESMHGMTAPVARWGVRHHYL